MINGKKVFQISTHIMPWEIDYCLILFDSLSRAKKLTNQTYRIDVGLNLSSYHIDWDNSKLDRDYFIDKMSYYSKLLSSFDEVNVKIYDGEDNYGHLDLQKSVIKSDNDYYINIAPDQLFDTSALSLFEQSVDSIKEKYFVLVSEIPRLWDTSWNVISNKQFDDTPFKSDGSYDYLSIDRYDALNIVNQYPVQLEKVHGIKYAGWFDLYSKAFYEELAPVPEEWKGYGQWDLYSMLIIINLYRMNYPIEFSQYKLTNLVTTSIEYSNWNYGENREIYKKRLALKDIPNQREYYNEHMNYYLNRQLNNIISKV